MHAGDRKSQEILSHNLVGPLRRHRCTWDDNIRIVLTEIRCEAVDWIHLAQGRDH
jgi:hypothetical protein